MSRKFTVLQDGEFRDIDVMDAKDRQQLAAYAKRKGLKGLKIDEPTITRKVYKPSKIFFNHETGDPIYLPDNKSNEGEE